MAGAIEGCLQMMTTMIQMQANQQQIFPFEFQSNMQSHQSGMVSKNPMTPRTYQIKLLYQLPVCFFSCVLTLCSCYFVIRDFKLYFCFVKNVMSVQ